MLQKLPSAAVVIDALRNKMFVYQDPYLYCLLQWLPLENVKRGLVHMKLVWLYLSKDPLMLNKVGHISLPIWYIIQSSPFITFLVITQIWI